MRVVCRARIPDHAYGCVRYRSFRGVKGLSIPGPEPAQMTSGVSTFAQARLRVDRGCYFVSPNASRAAAMA
jgi:hypothetical protein